MDSTITSPTGNLDLLHDRLRGNIKNNVKDFKVCWINLGQALFAVYRDKLYYGWGFEKFEHYTQRELGLKKQVAYKMVKSYGYLEEEEPGLLRDDYAETNEASLIPTVDAVNVVRLAKNKKELERADYLKIKKDVFEKGKDAGVVRKELTAMIKERKQVDPEEERRQRNEAAIKKFVTAIHSFSKDMEALKLISNDIVEEANELMKRLQDEMENTTN